MIRAAALTLTLLASAVQADDAMVSRKSAHSVSETLDRLTDVVEEKGFTVFARIDHAAGARKVGKSLRPTELLVFGNPAAGTALLASSQTIGVDLPIRVLAWEDADGQVWLGYTPPAELARRHGIEDREEVVAKMTGALAAFTEAASQ